MLTPTPRLSAKERDVLLTSLLRSNTPGTIRLQVLELVVPSEGNQEGRTPDAYWYEVPWPCGLETLERHIEAAIFATV